MKTMPTNITSYSRESLAQSWECSMRTIDRLIASGRLKAYRIGPRGIRVTEASINAYIELQEAAREQEE